MGSSDQSRDVATLASSAADTFHRRQERRPGPPTRQSTGRSTQRSYVSRSTLPTQSGWGTLRSEGSVLSEATTHQSGSRKSHSTQRDRSAPSISSTQRSRSSRRSRLSKHTLSRLSSGNRSRRSEGGGNPSSSQHRGSYRSPN